MQLQGTVMKIEHRAGDFVPNDSVDGKAIAYDFHVVNVWDGDQMREVRLPKGVTPAALAFAEGDRVDLAVSVPKGVRIFLHESELLTSAA